MSSDPDWYRQHVETLARLHRPSASPGEKQAAREIAIRLARLDWPARIERQRASGRYWSGMLAAMGMGLGGAALGASGRRVTGAALALTGGWAVWNDLSGRRHIARRPLARRQATNVVSCQAPTGADRDVILVAHHDAARSGTIFHPSLPRLLRRHLPATQSSPPLMWPVLAGPLLAAAGAASGQPILLASGAAVCGGAAGVFADIALHRTVPGANDNLSGVAALLGVAERLRHNPLQNTRVWLVSTGAEESFMEGMRGFAERHFRRLNRHRSLVVCVDTVGSDQLLTLEAEGMLRMYPYSKPAIDELRAVAEEQDIALHSGLRLRNATDGLIALRHGLPAVMLGSYDPEVGAPANYHWASDTAEAVNYGSVAQAAQLCEALLRRLDREWPALSQS